MNAPQAQPAVHVQTIHRFAFGEFHAEMGGHYAGIVRAQNGENEYHLFISPRDTDIPDIEFGNYGKKITGADSVNDGLANTHALIAHGGHPAAEACTALRSGGFDDWYLPAQAEAMLAFANCRDQFETEWYWTSTQYSADYAWVQSFDYGLHDSGPKGDEYRARAVRRVSVI